MRFFRSLFHRLGKLLAHPRVVVVWARVFNPRASDFSLGAVKSLLVLKLDEIGDFVLASAFLRELRRNAPQADITLVVKPGVFNLAEKCPYVNRVLTYDWRLTQEYSSVLRQQWRALRLAYSELRKCRFDVVLIPRWDADTYHATQLAVYSGGRAIVAYSEKCTETKSTINRGFDRLVSHVIPPVQNCLHEIEANLGILKTYGIVSGSSLELWLTENDLDFARVALPDGPKYVAIATGASKAYKCWPVAHFSLLGMWLQQKYGLTPVLLGAKDDPSVREARSFLGKSLRETAAIVARCILFVGNDSGLKHIAAAVGTPVVEINALRMGSPVSHHISPVRFRAWNVVQRVVQPPIGMNHCAIEEVSFSAVQAAIDALMQELNDGALD